MKQKEETEALIRKGKYCYIVMHVGDTDIYIWSYLKARFDTGETFRYIKTSIYDSTEPRKIYFENGYCLYFQGGNIYYNGDCYQLGASPNIMVYCDALEIGQFIRLYE